MLVTFQGMNMKVEKHIPNGPIYVHTGHSEPAPTSAS